MEELEATIEVLTKEEAKLFIRAFEREANAKFRKIKANTVVSYHIREINEQLGRFTYNEVVNKEITGCLVIARGANGKAKIVNLFHVTRQKLHTDLNIQPRTQVKQSERRWSTR